MMLDLTNLSLYACKMETGSRTCEHSNNLLIKSVDWGLLKADINLIDKWILYILYILGFRIINNQIEIFYS